MDQAVFLERKPALLSASIIWLMIITVFFSAFDAWSDPVNYRLSNQFYNSLSNKDYVLSHWETYDSITISFNREKYTIVNPQYLSTNEWVHCVINLTNTELQAWINGALTIKKEREYLTYFNTSFEPTYIGNNLMSGEGDNNHFHGAIDEFRVYSRGLTEEEIQALYIDK